MISLGLIFKVILAKDIVYNNGIIENIKGINFVNKNIIF